MSLAYEKIPLELKADARFCVYVMPAKIPYNPKTGARAKSNDPATFGTFSEATAALERNPSKYSGIGVGMFGDLVGIDIDHCVDEFGLPSPFAKDIIRLIDSYTEYSPSGSGVHILCRAPDLVYDKRSYYEKKSDLGLEVYPAGQTSRYLTLTGHAMSDEGLNERTAEVLELLKKYMKRDSPMSDNRASAPDALIREASTDDDPVSEAIDDAELLDRMRRSEKGERIAELWAGEWARAGYKSQSEADMALCNDLAFWTRKDPMQVDRLFRQSGLMRDKWDRPQSGSTYGAITIQNAIVGCKAVLEPGYNTKASSNTTETTPERLETVTASELFLMELPPLHFAVEGLLPQGLNILASPPKTGKSWMCLDLSLCVANGAPFLGMKTNKSGVLYLALEDGIRRIQDRLLRISGTGSIPSELRLATRAGTLDCGILEQLEDHISRFPDTKLVIIDTLQKVRGKTGKNEGAYASDYREIGALKSFADKHNVCMIVVHHLRKMADSDPFQRVSGTAGITGAADTTLVLCKIDTGEAHLSFEGRDVESSELVLTFNKESCKWELIGTLEDSLARKERSEYSENAIVITVKQLLEENSGKWRGTSTELLEECARRTLERPVDSARALTGAIHRLAPKLKEYDGIAHLPPPENGVNGRRCHEFKKIA